MIVYEKYKRKLHLEHWQLLRLRDHVCQFAEARRDAGKPVGKDLLTQEASAYCKKTWTPSSR